MASAQDDTVGSSGGGGDTGESMFLATTGFVALCIAQIAYGVYYYGWVWLVTKFAYKFVGWGVGGPLPIPGRFVDKTFTEHWLALSWAIFNVFPPLCGLWILTRPRSLVRFDIHRLSIFVAGGINVGLLIYLCVWVWFAQNGSSYYPTSIANTPEYCCKFYGSVALSGECENLNDCSDLPTSGTIRLSTSDVWWGHTYSLAIYLGFAIGQMLINVMYRNYVTSTMESGDSETALGVPPTAPSAGKSDTRLHVLNAFYLLLVCLMLTCGVLVLDVRHTHDYPASAPDGLRSARKGVEVAGMVLSTGVSLLMPAAVLFAILGAQGRPWMLVVAFLVMLGLAGGHMFGLMTMMYSRGISNTPGYPNSLANHPLRCCAVDTRSDPGSECSNGGGPAGACVLPAQAFSGFTDPLLTSNQIPNNPWHTLILVFTLALSVLDVVLITVVFAAYLSKALSPVLARATGIRADGIAEFINSYAAPPVRRAASSSSSTSSTSTAPSRQWPRPPTLSLRMPPN